MEAIWGWVKTDYPVNIKLPANFPPLQKSFAALPSGSYLRYSFAPFQTQLLSITLTVHSGDHER